MVRSAAKEATPRYTYDVNQSILPPVAGSKPALVKDFGEAKEKKEVSAFHKRMREDIQKKNIEWRKQVESTNYKFKEGDIYKGSNGINYKIIAKTLYKKNNKTPAVPAYKVEGANGETTTLIEGLMKPESIYTGPKKNPIDFKAILNVKKLTKDVGEFEAQQIRESLGDYIRAIDEGKGTSITADLLTSLNNELKKDKPNIDKIFNLIDTLDKDLF